MTNKTKYWFFLDQWVQKSIATVERTSFFLIEFDDTYVTARWQLPGRNFQEVKYLISEFLRFNIGEAELDPT